MDDDDEDGVTDKDNEIIDDGGAVDDHHDLAPIILRQCDVPTGWLVRLELHDPTNVNTNAAIGPVIQAEDVVRIFSERSGTATAIIGPTQGPNFTLPETAAHGVDLATLRNQDIELAIEGLEFAGEIKLKVELANTAGLPSLEDELQIKIAPLILLNHLDDTTTTFVAAVGGNNDSFDYTTTTFPDATPPGVTDVLIPPFLSGNDPWAQDEFQICFQQAPYGSMHVLLDSKRNGGLNTFTTATAAAGGLFGPDFGHIQVSHPTELPNSLDSFGNLEASPPCTVGGKHYPFGRIYYGDWNGTSGDRMDSALRAFLERQQVQSPVALYSDWLLVGHVDEFMSIVPDASGTHGWKVLFADPVTAVEILSGMDPSTAIPRYRDHDWVDDPQNPTQFHNVDTIGALLTRPLTDTSTTGIRDYNTNGGPAPTELVLIRSEVQSEFGLTSADFINIPALFDHVSFTVLGNTYSGALAISPNMVNGSVYNGWYLAPDPLFFPNTGQPDLDPFRNHLFFNLPPQMPLRWLDDWNVYHLNEGEVHCSSNEIRAIPTSKWWESYP